MRIVSPIVDGKEYKGTLSPAFQIDKVPDAPVVGVFGTSQQVGKFTTQLALRRGLLRLGYKVGQLGTEPQSALFGFDFTFPIGYNCSVHLPLQSYVPVLREKMCEIDASHPHIIIVGSQAGTIPFTRTSVPYSLPTIAFLYGTVPDAFILVVNTIDPDDYIRETITALKVLGKAETILLVFSDRKKVIRSAFGANRIIRQKMSRDEINEQIERLERKFNIAATEVVSEEGQEKLVNTVIEYFSEG